ncbi:hypothetical protein ACHAW6_002897 [Cyclotella cf. meneghiniana]
MDQSSAQTLKAKQAYEQFASEHGVRIYHYHCNNCRFDHNTFRQHAEQQQQTLTFCDKTPTGEQVLQRA